MLVNKRRLGSANSLLSTLEPNGGLSPSQVHSGIGKKHSYTNLTDEDSCPESFLSSKGSFSVGNNAAFTPEMLEGLAATDEISDVLDRLVSYIAVMPDLGSSFAYVDFLPSFVLPENTREKTIAEFQKHWLIVQTMLFKNAASITIGIHSFISSWLTYGKLYIAIVRKVQNGEVIDIHAQHEPFKELTSSQQVKYWQTNCEQVIWDKADCFMLDWSVISQYTISYVATIMRKYNLFKTIERTRVANAVMSAQFRSVYTVPTAGLGKVKARQKLSAIMGLYKREVRINDSTGETTINGENSYPVNTELWVSETSGGAVKIENPGDGNVNLKDTDFVDYFMRKFYKQAKLPMSKYEAVDAGYLNGLAEIDEDERQFNLYIQKLRATLSKLFIGITWQLMQPLTEYSGRTELSDNACMIWHDEPKHETPEEALDNLSEKLDKIENILEKYSTSLNNAGFGERQIKARMNVLRIKLMRKYCPDILEQTAEDYSNIPEEEQADTSSDWNTTEDSASSESGSDDFNDWDNDKWDDEFSDGNDDWSMPENTNDNESVDSAF